MPNVKAVLKTGKRASKRAKYDFSCKNPNAIITPGEEANFNECMRRKNESASANTMSFKEAAESIDFDRLFP